MVKMTLFAGAFLFASPALAQDGLVATAAPFLVQLIPILIGVVIAVLATRFGIKVPDGIAANVKAAAVTAARGALAKHLRAGLDPDAAIKGATDDTAIYVEAQMATSVKKLGMDSGQIKTLAQGVAEEAAFEMQAGRKEGWG